MICEYGCGKEASFQLKNGKWCCEKYYQSCEEVKRKNSGSLKNAYKINKNIGFKGKTPWNKGLNKNTDTRILNSSIKSSNSLKNIKKSPMTDKHKQAISNGMKLAHKEGRAKSWNREESYPEKFFTRVIENEFNDKDYTKEYPFFKYWLDFAWLHKKICIEIDGSQHEQYERQRLSDIKKDTLLIENGWKFLRIRWVDIFHNTRTWIDISKSFVDDSVIISNEELNALKIKNEKCVCAKCGCKIRNGRKTNLCIVCYKELRSINKGKSKTNENENKCEECGRNISKMSYKKCKKCSNVDKFKFDKSVIEMEDVVKERLKQIEHIDLTKYGWVAKVAKIWNISHTQVRRFMKKYYTGVVYTKKK